ncbi:MAG: prepilin-type N-terminal cleavage/methylation domain-containing protein [Candidatus Pacebacteria bacterium]|nr:prepilin-type N-terminal cleavage/methylation domain-containing protein [Candidatus Paceibacterota bacterium]
MKIISKITRIDFKKRQLESDGFSLIEVIIAIGIITVGIVSIVNLLSFNLKNEIKNKNKVIAIYLAQEGIEVVRQIRDNNFFIGSDWLTGIDNNKEVPIITDSEPDGDIDQTDLLSGWILSDISGIKKRIYLHNTEKYYVQSDVDLSGFADYTDTGFSRVLSIKKGTGGGSKCEADTGDYCLRVKSAVIFDDVKLAEITAYLYGQWY